jgi:Fic family protein
MKDKEKTDSKIELKFCNKCKKETYHSINTEYRVDNKNNHLNSYFKMCNECKTPDLIHLETLLSEEELSNMNNKEITGFMNKIIDKMDADTIRMEIKQDKINKETENNSRSITGTVHLTLSLIKKLTSKEILILNQIIYKKDILNNEVYVNQVEISNELDLKQPNVSRSIKKLVELNYISKIGDNRYNINFLSEFDTFRV